MLFGSSALDGYNLKSEESYQAEAQVHKHHMLAAQHLRKASTANAHPPLPSRPPNTARPCGYLVYWPVPGDGGSRAARFQARFMLR